MSPSTWWNPGDDVLIWGVNVLLQVTLVIAIALLFSSRVRRGPAVRYWILCSSLLLVLSSPAIALVMQLSGRSLLSVSLAQEGSASIGDNTAAAALSEETQPPERSPSSLRPEDLARIPNAARGFTADDFGSLIAESRVRGNDRHAEPRAKIGGAMASPTPTSRPPNAAMAVSLLPRSTETWIGKVFRVVMRPLLLIWLTGAVFLLARLAVGWCRLAAILRSAKPNTNAALAESFEQAGRLLQVARLPALVLSERVSGPVAASLFRPRVVLPERIVDRVNPKQLQDIFVHEVAHIVRRDQVVVLLQNVAAAIFWLHPLTKALNRRLAQAREEICDNYVLVATDAPSYGRTLLTLAELVQAVRPLPGAVGLFTSTWKLERRVAGLLDENRSRTIRLSARGKAFVIALSLVTTTIAALGTMTLAVGQTADGDDLANGTAQQPQDALQTDPAADPFVTDDAPTKGTGEEAAQPNSAEKVALHYRGRVLAPNGVPVAGAKIFFVYWMHGAMPSANAEPRAITDAAGWFDFSTTRDDFEPGAGDAFLMCSLVAMAEGFGFGENFSLTFETTGRALELLPSRTREYWAKRNDDSEPVIRLVRDDVPLTGRVANLDGQPVEGARVRVVELSYNDTGSLDAWEQAALAEKADYYSLRNHAPDGMNGPQLPSVLPDVLTDADGRFTLRGIGRERIAELLISGPGIEAKKVKARTRRGAKIAVPHQWDFPESGREIYFPAAFTHVAGPSKPIVGRVTDADTGKPLAGVLIRAGHLGTFAGGGKSFITAVTNDDGHYQLEGLTVGEEEQIYVYPPIGTAYLPAGFFVSLRIDQPQIARNLKLKQGVWVRGRAIDDRTGDAVAGRVQYYAFTNNPHLKSYQGFAYSAFSYERRTDDEGRFEIPVLPGLGVVTFMALDHTHYRRGLGTETVTGPSNDGGAMSEVKMFRTVPSSLTSVNEHLLRQINPEVGSKPIDLTLTLTSGVDVPGRLIDEDGQPVSGGVVSGTIYPGAWNPVQGESFRIEGYYSDRPRELFAYHMERDLVGYYRLEGEAPPEVVINLQRASTVRGRLVDDAGAPRSGVKLSGEGVPDDNAGNVDLRLETDDDGRFVIRGLIPGRKYTVLGSTDREHGGVPIDVSVEAGGTTDVGDVKLEPLHESTDLSSTPALNDGDQSSGDSVRDEPGQADVRTASIRGQVVFQDGSPAAGAFVSVVGFKTVATGRPNGELLGRRRRRQLGSLRVVLARRHLEIAPLSQSYRSDGSVWSSLASTGFGCRRDIAGCDAATAATHSSATGGSRRPAGGRFAS